MIATKQQRQSIKKVYLRVIHESEPNLNYREFRRRVQQGWGCLMVPFASMWLGIEPDGYTHS